LTDKLKILKKKETKRIPHNVYRIWNITRSFKIYSEFPLSSKIIIYVGSGNTDGSMLAWLHSQYL